MPEQLTPDQRVNLSARLTRLDAHIRFEFDLTAARISYLAASESFLFIGYCAAIASPNVSSPGPIQAAIQGLPWLGSALAIIVMMAVFAAFSVATSLKKDREALSSCAKEVGLDADDVLLGSTSWQNVLGWAPPFFVPTAFVVAWVYIGVRFSL